MNLREKLLTNKPQLQTLDINGTTYYLRSMTVGDVNKQAFEFRNWLIQQADIAGEELPSMDDDRFDEALERFGAKFRLPQAIASRLCDKEGKLLFDPQNIDDLNAIAELDNQVFIEFNKAITPKRFSERRKFQLTLSLALGKTLEEIEQMPESHFVEYQQFYQEQPFGLWREDYRTAQISHLLAMINRNPKEKSPVLTDFMPFYRKKCGQKYR